MTKISNYVRPGAAAKTWPSTPGSSSTLNPLTATLDDLSDVDTSGVGDGDALTYDAGSSTWVPGPGGGGLDSVTDGVVTVTPATSLVVPGGSLTDGGAGEADLAYVTPTLGGQEVVNTVAAAGATETLDLADGNIFDVTLSEACAVTTAGWVAGVSSTMTIVFRPGGFDPTFTDTIDWLGGSTPTWPSADDQYVVVLWSFDGGTSIGGTLVGSGSGFSGGTPALTLSTSNSAGVAATGIRTDATIAAFDATVPTTAAFGDSAATGSAGYAARRDHRHGMPAASGVGELLISDTPSTPLVFADILQNEAQDDLLYADP